jgi:GTP cyclohydrolase I
MTKAEAEEEFREEVLPYVRETYEKDGLKDIPARAEAWNNFTDALCKSGRISIQQYETWGHPR